VIVVKKITFITKKILLSLIGMGLLTSLSFLDSSLVFAQKIPPTWSTNSYKPPKNIGKPTDTLPGGVRGGTFNVIPVVPRVENSYFGVTLEAYPTFLLYIPQLTPDTKYAQFSLQDQEGNEIYQTNFVLNVSNQIITISLPDQAGLTPLEINQDYQWNFSIFSDSLRITTAKINSSGLIRRVETPSQLQSQPPNIMTLDPESRLVQARLYAESAIWYDTVAKLAQLYREYPDDWEIKQDWEDLLISAQLNSLVKVPLFSIVK
jgi:Domain of Unknown Function (DUF928)